MSSFGISYHDETGKTDLLFRIVRQFSDLDAAQSGTVLVRVLGEPHGIRRRPSHWMAKMLNIAGWFEKHSRKDAND
jgi:hypothetical protein